MTLTAGATVRTPDGLIRTVKEWPYWFNALNKGSGPLVLLNDDTAFAREAVSPVVRTWDDNWEVAS